MQNLPKGFNVVAFGFVMVFGYGMIIYYPKQELRWSPWVETVQVYSVGLELTAQGLGFCRFLNWALGIDPCIILHRFSYY